MGLVSSNYLIVPMMADFSSLEGIKGVLMLLYGEYPSSALKKYAEDIVTFTNKITEFNLSLPTFYEFAFNNFTANLGVARAFDSVKTELINFCYNQWKKENNLFANANTAINSINDWESAYVSNIKDFHTAGKVSASLGIPIHRLPNHSTYTMPDHEVVILPKKNYVDSLSHIRSFVNKIE